MVKKRYATKSSLSVRITLQHSSAFSLPLCCSFFPRFLLPVWSLFSFLFSFIYVISVCLLGSLSHSHPVLCSSWPLTLHLNCIRKIVLLTMESRRLMNKIEDQSTSIPLFFSLGFSLSWSLSLCRFPFIVNCWQNNYTILFWRYSLD